MSGNSWTILAAMVVSSFRLPTERARSVALPAGKAKKVRKSSAVVTIRSAATSSDWSGNIFRTWKMTGTPLEERRAM